MVLSVSARCAATTTSRARSRAAGRTKLSLHAPRTAFFVLPHARAALGVPTPAACLHVGADTMLDGVTRHVDSYYSRTSDASVPAFVGSVPSSTEFDIAIVGGGLAGINVALSAASRGQRVVLLEKNRLAWAASGRNGGFAHPGYSLDLFSLAKRLGDSHARALWQLTFDSLDMMRSRMNKWVAQGRAAENVMQPGMVVASWFNKPLEATQAEADEANRILDCDYFQVWERERVRATYATTRYHHALYDPDSFHFHSLNYALQVAHDARLAGAHILEHTPVTRVELGASAHKLHTARGSVTAKNIVLAGSAYMPRLAGARRVTRAVLPVMTYACVTEPLGDRLHHVMRAPHAVTDSRFACDYYRPLSDGRILWGGRIDCLGIEPSRLADKLHADMCVVYPQLADVRVDVAWPGVMGYARHKMPLLGKLPDVPGVWYATGFGGHGVCPTTVAGELIAAAIAEGDERYKLFKPFGLQWTGGPLLGSLAAQSFYWWYEFRDALRELRFNRGATLAD